MNKVLGIGLIGLGAYGLIKLLRMKNVSDSISTNLVNPRIHKVSLSGISFRTEVAIGWLLEGPTRTPGCRSATGRTSTEHHP